MDIERDDQSVNEDDASEEESSVALSDLDAKENFIRDLERVRNNDPDVTDLSWYSNHDILQTMTNEGWEAIGRDISNNTYLEELIIIQGALDGEKLSSLFRGLSKSSAIVKLDLDNNDFSRAGLTSLEPFLQNSINLRELDVRNNNIQSGGFTSLLQALCGSPIEILYCYNCGITSIEIETVPNNLQLLSLGDNDMQSKGFNRLLRSLRDSSIEELDCNDCGIESVEIDTDSLPKNLTGLYLSENRINTNGCRGIAKLLQKTNTLKTLFLRYNSIGDDGVATIVDALKTNTSLKYLYLEDNNGISNIGHILILKMLNDISSIKSTLQSNHTLQSIDLEQGEIGSHISDAIKINKTCSKCPEAAGRQKVIQSQLHSRRRGELVAMQGVQSQSLYGEIKSLHLPEVLSLVGRRHGQEELYLALKASIAELLSTVNKKLCLQQRRSYNAEEIDAEIAALDSADGSEGGIESRGNKRPRV